LLWLLKKVGSALAKALVISEYNRIKAEKREGTGLWHPHAIDGGRRQDKAGRMQARRTFSRLSHGYRD
jgi:hypothetical protein